MSNTTADKLNYLIATKNAIKQAIIDKGVTVPANATFRDYATLISQIQTGYDTSDATAAAADIAIGKKAYNSTGAVTGTFDVTTSEIPEVGGTIDEAQEVADEIIGNIVNSIVS